MANGFVHSAGGIAEGVYNTGLVTAAFLFIPLSLWVVYACAVRGPYSGKVVGAAIAAGAVTHAVLFVGYGLFKAGVIRQCGPGALWRRGRFHADHLGGPCEPVL
jgi:hypothetical protein